MNPRVLNIFGLVSCFLFLAGNIIYDWVDNSPPDPPGYFLYHVFFIPFSIMICALMLIGFDYSKKIGGWTCILWWGFCWLSASQLIKFVFFNATVRMISDYGFLALVLIGVTYKLYLYHVKNNK